MNNKLFFFILSNAPYNIRDIKNFIIFFPERSSDAATNEIVITCDGVHHPLASLQFVIRIFLVFPFFGSLIEKDFSTVLIPIPKIFLARAIQRSFDVCRFQAAGGVPVINVVDVVTAVHMCHGNEGTIVVAVVMSCIDCIANLPCSRSCMYQVWLGLGLP